MTDAGLDKLIWVLIYGGLLLLCLGLFVRRQDAGFGLTIIAGGAVTAVVGAVLIWVRSRTAATPDDLQANVPTE